MPIVARLTHRAYCAIGLRGKLGGLEKPDDAWWDDKDQEWVHGAKDAQGRLVGVVRYWDKDGSLISTADHVDGKPHGTARRFVNGAMTQECTYVDGVIDGVRRFIRPARELQQCAATVVAYECSYERGDLVGTTYRHSHGHECDAHGRALRKRPSNIEPTASPFPSDGWVFMRRRGEAGEQTLITREYYEDGTLKLELVRANGSERRFYKNGQLASEGKRDYSGPRPLMVGAWRYYDANGQLRRVEHYEAGTEVRREWHRTEREANGGALVREGPVVERQEVGMWGDIDLGVCTRDAQLLAHAVTGDILDDAIAVADRSIVSMLARARRAGIEQDASLLGLDETPAWRMLDDNGALVSLGKSHYDNPIVRYLHALRWGPPDGAMLAQIAAALFSADRAQAALDVVDAALLLGSDATWHTARTAYLRATGRAPVVASVLDERARTLLDEIRARPEDDAPRLVFADHIASTFPTHTALIVAQCAGNTDEAIVRAFQATLPAWLVKQPPTRGFLEALRDVEASDFVSADPDLLHRLAPGMCILELQFASHHIAQLVTLPALRRITELSFNDTYISLVSARQLARCIHLDDLEHLGLWSTNLDDAELQALCAGPAYPRLQSIDIGQRRFDEMTYGLDGMRALGDAPFAASLRALAMQNRCLGDGIVEVIAKLPALVDLDLRDGALSDDGARALVDLPNAWTSLALGGNGITEATQAALTARLGERVRFTR
jgi:antitoxin component YwqK of YwqJK toxin-antitoxin module